MLIKTKRGVPFLFLMFLTIPTYALGTDLIFFNNSKEARITFLSEKSQANFEQIAQDNAKKIETLKLKLQDLEQNKICEESTLAVIQHLDIDASLKEKILITRAAQLLDNQTTRALITFSQLDQSVSYTQKISTTEEISWPSQYDQSITAGFDRLNKWVSEGECWVDSLQGLSMSIKSAQEKKNDKKNVSKKYLRDLIDEAHEIGSLSDETLIILSQMIKHNYQKSDFNLSNYAKKIKGIHNQFPASNSTSPALLTSKRQKTLHKESYRELFLQKYDVIQIAMLRKVLEKMRTRFESNEIEIHIINNGEIPTEVIDLDPMERYRFVVKLFRKEWDALKLHGSFQGKNILFTDFLLSGFETGLIHVDELDQLLELEELWDPKEPWWQKAITWGAMFGKLGAAFIPPPYGYLAIMGIVVIEGIANQQQGEQNGDQAHSLF